VTLPCAQARRYPMAVRATQWVLPVALALLPAGFVSYAVTVCLAVAAAVRSA